MYLLFLPIVIVGIIVAAYKQIAVSKKLGVSATAMDILQGRWFMHMFHVRKDDATIALMKNLPTGSHYGQLIFALPMFITHKLTGYLPAFAGIPKEGEETLASFIAWRTPIFDQHIQDQLPNITQIVSMGAGYDSKGFNSVKNNKITLYELDMSEIQKLKIEALKKANIFNDQVVYVPVDFNHESWSDKLLEAGYKTDEKTIFIYEGVTLYLNEETVIQSIEDVDKITCEGSSLVFDYYSKQFVEKTMANKKSSQYLSGMNESLKFGVDTSDAEIHINKLIENTKFKITSNRLVAGKNKMKKFVGVVFVSK